MLTVASFSQEILHLILHLFCAVINNHMVLLNLCGACDCAAYRTGLWVVPAVGRGGSKLLSFGSARRGKLLFVHSDVELGSHRRFNCFPPVRLKVMNILLLPCHLVAPPFPSYLSISFTYAFFCIIVKYVCVCGGGGGSA